MIRVNLLGERPAVRKRFVIATGQKLVVGCSAILLVSGGIIAWRYLVVSRASHKVDAELAVAQKEATRLHAIIAQVQQFEQRRAQLQQRVGLIERLRADQTGPVHMLDEISKALPPMLWLTALKQSPAGNEVVIDGRSATLTGLSDFVTNLQTSGYFQRSVEIVNSSTESKGGEAEIIHFQIKAVFRGSGTDAPAAETAAPAGRGGA